MSESMSKNVLIVDDSKLMRIMLRKIVEELQVFDVIEEAENRLHSQKAILCHLFNYKI